MFFSSDEKLLFDSCSLSFFSTRFYSFLMHLLLLLLLPVGCKETEAGAAATLAFGPVSQMVPLLIPVRKYLCVDPLKDLAEHSLPIHTLVRRSRLKTLLAHVNSCLFFSPGDPCADLQSVIRFAERSDHVIERREQKRWEMCVFTRPHPVLITGDRDDQRVVLGPAPQTHRLSVGWQSQPFVQRHALLHRVPDCGEFASREIRCLTGISGGGMCMFWSRGREECTGVVLPCNRLLVVCLCRLSHPSHTGSASSAVVSRTLLIPVFRLSPRPTPSLPSLRTEFCAVTSAVLFPAIIPTHTFSPASRLTWLTWVVMSSF